MQWTSSQHQYWLKNQMCTVCDFWRAAFTNKLTSVCRGSTFLWVAPGRKGLTHLPIGFFPFLKLCMQQKSPSMTPKKTHHTTSENGQNAGSVPHDGFWPLLYQKLCNKKYHRTEILTTNPRTMWTNAVVQHFLYILVSYPNKTVHDFIDNMMAMINNNQPGSSHTCTKTSLWHQPANQSTNHPFNCPNQPSNQPTNPPFARTNQPTNQPPNNMLEP